MYVEIIVELCRINDDFTIFMLCMSTRFRGIVHEHPMSMARQITDIDSY